ncbi:endonuclease [Acinetobacter phage VB_AB_Acb75]
MNGYSNGKIMAYIMNTEVSKFQLSRRLERFIEKTPMRAAKIDANQPEIVAALRKIGCTVQILSSVGKGCPDILVGYRGKNFLLEIKDGAKPVSAQKLTPDQIEWHDLWNGQVNVVNCVDQAIQVVTCN